MLASKYFKTKYLILFSENRGVYNFSLKFNLIFSNETHVGVVNFASIHFLEVFENIFREFN